jgi:hypothetical protein
LVFQVICCHSMNKLKNIFSLTFADRMLILKKIIIITSNI